MHKRRPIRITGARTHNLKDVSVQIPQAKLTVITGVSGSGKSSLAFDTLYAEGQRRYAESLSTYARQFLERLDRPDVDSIEPVPPAVALEQRNGITNARSTVGTQTEVADGLRLLFANGGETICPRDGHTAKRGTADFAMSEIAALPEGTRVALIAPLSPPTTKAARALFLPELTRAGFFRSANPEGGVVEFAPTSDVKPLLDADGKFPLLLGRFAVRRDSLSEIEGGVGTALRLAGHLLLLIYGDNGVGIRTRVFRRGLFCPECGREFRDPTPALFAFNSPLGACVTCQGFGRIVGIDWDKVIPDRELTLADHPIAPWNTPAYQSTYRDLFRAGRRIGLRRNVPYRLLTDAERSLIESGDGDFYGIRGFFEWLETKRYKVHVRVLLSRYRAYTKCPACGGARLNPDALAVNFHGQTLPELARMPIGELAAWFSELRLSAAEQRRHSSVLFEIRSRLAYLVEVGLDYLTLDRAARTLSGGEAQRIALSCALGGALTDTLYVLDEPTIGLHSRDTEKLLAIVRKLADRGNTVVLVEHDLDVIGLADHVIDLGPKAGAEGGNLLFEGTPGGLARLTSSATGRALRRLAKPLPVPNVVPFRRAAEAAVTIVGASEHNLKNLTVRLPLGRLVALTGVSGSGKSTLLRECFFNYFQRRIKGAGNVDVGRVRSIEGLDAVSDVLFVDQSPLGRSARSNSVTYMKAYDDIRELFARTGRAKAFAVTARDFSFNTPGGRCEACQGTGVQTIDMQFLADAVVTCDRCDGRRFSSKVLGIRYRGKNIDEVLRLTVAEAGDFFRDSPKILRKLAPLSEVGLTYLPLGQPTATLSGGEAQRLKLASFLEDRPSAGRILFLFDEPTTGLHSADVDQLLATLRKLISRGHSVVAIEHHLDFIAASDWVIDLGPSGGEAGGELVVEGTPREVAESGRGFTSEALVSRFLPAEPAVPGRRRRVPTVE